MLDLIALNILLMLVIYMFKDEMNLSLLLLPIGIIICFLKEPLVVMLIFSLGLPKLLIVL